MNSAPNFKHLTNEELHQKTLRVARTEKDATLNLLHHLAEVDTRRLYATRAYSTLFEYVHRALHYSEAQASDRVSAMRLMCRVPEVKAQLQSGKLSLTTAARLASHVRREKLSESATHTLLDQVAGKSAREVERIFVAQATTSMKLQRAHPISPTLTRITFDVSSEFMEELERMKTFHGNPTATYEELFLRAMREFVKKRNSRELRAPEVRRGGKADLGVTEPKREKRKNTKAPEADRIEAGTKSRETKSRETESRETQFQETEAQKTESHKTMTPDATIPGGASGEAKTRETKPREIRTSAATLAAARNRYIPARVREQVRMRSGNQCEYRDSKTQRRCESRRSLQWEHVRPFGKGGENSFSNLKHFCPAHNRLMALRAYGAQKMNAYLDRKLE